MQTIGFKEFADSLLKTDPSALFSKFDGILHSDNKSSFNLKLPNGAEGGPTSLTIRFFDKQKLAEIKRLAQEGKYTPTDAFKEFNSLIEKGRIIIEYKDQNGALCASSSDEIIQALKSGKHRLIKKSTHEVCEYKNTTALQKDQFSQFAKAVDSTLKLSDVKKEAPQKVPQPAAQTAVQPTMQPATTQPATPPAAPKTAPSPSPEKAAPAKPQEPQTNPKEVDPPEAEVFSEAIIAEEEKQEPQKEVNKETKAPEKAQEKAVEAPKAAAQAPKPQAEAAKPIVAPKTPEKAAEAPQAIKPQVDSAKPTTPPKAPEKTQEKPAEAHKATPQAAKPQVEEVKPTVSPMAPEKAQEKPAAEAPKAAAKAAPAAPQQQPQPKAAAAKPEAFLKPPTADTKSAEAPSFAEMLPDEPDQSPKEVP